MENLGLIISPEAYEKISQTETFVCPKNPGPLCLAMASTNPAPPKRTRGQIVCTKNKTDDPTVTFTAADIVQQKVTHDKLLRSYIECQVLE